MLVLLVTSNTLSTAYFKTRKYKYVNRISCVCFPEFTVHPWFYIGMINPLLCDLFPLSALCADLTILAIYRPLLGRCLLPPLCWPSGPTLTFLSALDRRPKFMGEKNLPSRKQVSIMDIRIWIFLGNLWWAPVSLKSNTFFAWIAWWRQR